MKTFIFTYHSSTEPLAKIKAKDKIEAILRASMLKNLESKEFLKIFKVEEYDEKKDRQTRKINEYKNGGK